VVYIEVLTLDIYYIMIQIKIYKLELKPKYINNYNIYTTRIKKYIYFLNYKKQKKDTS